MCPVVVVTQYNCFNTLASFLPIFMNIRPHEVDEFDE